MNKKRHFNYEQFFYFLLPVFLILGGIRTVVTSTFSMWSKIVAVGFQAQVLGIILIILGLVFLLILVRGFLKKKDENYK
ncbi:MAG: hypothetical protein ABIE74_00360 [Pseudomonadota bacterium]